MSRTMTKADPREKKAAALPAVLQRKKICAWCDTEMQSGVEPASHGICTPCRELYFPHSY
jgi:hypothetical protein